MKARRCAGVIRCAPTLRPFTSATAAGHGAQSVPLHFSNPVDALAARDKAKPTSSIFPVAESSAKQKITEGMHPVMAEYKSLPFSLDEDQLPVVKLMEGVFDKVVAGQYTKGLYIHGGCGCGKTALSDVLFRALSDKTPSKHMHWHELIMRAWHVMNLFDKEKAEKRRLAAKKPKTPKKESSGGWFSAFSRKSSAPPKQIKAESDDAMQARYFEDTIKDLNVKALFIDDVVITAISDAMVVKCLFEAAMKHNMVLVMTSNYAPESLYAPGNVNRDRFSGWATSWFPANCHVHNMGVRKDYREQMYADTRADRFVHPISDETRSQFEAAFKSCGSEHDGPSSVAVGVRRVKVPRCTEDKSTAYFDFKQLFGSNLGREDFAAIVAEYPKVFLANVPVMDHEMKYEFTRFAVFTDLAYRKNTELWMLCEDEVPEIYPGSSMEVLEDGQWAWKRTKSHLLEMNTTGWLKA